MNTTTRLWILGASDPEMSAIEALLRQCGERVCYAESAPGVRVHSGNAYRALRIDADAQTDCYFVECDEVGPPRMAYDPMLDNGVGLAEGGLVQSKFEIDHHRPGDPGFGRPPEEFFTASSIGQVVVTLARLGVLHRQSDWHSAGSGYGSSAVGDLGHDGNAIVSARDESCGVVSSLQIPREIVLTAAADHCLGAAYAGQCRGVDPDELLAFRAAQRAAHQGRTVDAVLTDVEAANYALYVAATEQQSGLVNMRSTPMAELPDAAARYGYGYIATAPAGPDGRTKIVIGGRTTPDMIRAWLTDWAPAHGLVDCYGDPDRGFAGGYLPA